MSYPWPPQYLSFGVLNFLQHVSILSPTCFITTLFVAAVVGLLSHYILRPFSHASHLFFVT